MRIVAGAVFVIFGLGKFTSHASEVASFKDYGLPAPEAFVYGIGLLEVGGGLLLIAGLLTRVVAVLMAGNMVAAIVLSGIGDGEVIPSLTLAPLLLAGMLTLAWTGAGKHSFDERALERLNTGETDTSRVRYRR